MKWITAGDLEKWTAAPAAKLELSGLVADLIRASSPAITAIRFPTGAKGQVRGFDGVLESDVAGLNVPEGKSIWEFGTEAGYQGKAEDDLENRKADANAGMTFICVSPHTWDNGKKKLQDWEEEQTKKYGWKKVTFLDGAKLEDWLAAHDAVAAYHARYTLKIAAQDGARSLEEFWASYSDRYKPTLTEEVVLCGREDAAEQIISTLTQGPDLLTLSADAPDEVIALAIAAIRKQKPELRYFLEARTIVIDSADVVRKLAPNNKLSFLLRGDATRTPGVFAQNGPTINALGRAQKRGHSQRIDRPTSYQMADALSTMKFDVKKGMQLAKASGGSLTVLARQIPNGQYDPPEWVKNSNELLPAIFAGAWDNSRDADCEVVKALSGKDYLAYEATIRPLVHMPDPPIDNEGSMWKVRAPMDAFTECGHLIGPEHLETLRPIFTKVFSQIPAEDEDSFIKKQSPDEYSSWLRDGLAGTLLLIAVWQEQAGLKFPAGLGQKFADELVGSLPGLKDDHRLIVALREQLPILAEAAPSPLLSALELMLEGQAEAIKPVFNLEEGFMTPRSDHTGLLWALEGIAWDPTHFQRAVMVLARLAAIDPGIKLVNKPINSLKEIFLPWLRNTNASPAQRLSSLDEIIAVLPDVGWELLRGLLPSGHGVSSGTHKPLLRTGEPQTRSLTNRDVWEMYGQIVDRAVSAAGTDPVKLRPLLTGFHNYSPPDQEKVFKAVEHSLTSNPSEELWKTLRDVVVKHERFADAAWALPADQLKKWSDLASKFEPKDPISKASWLFDDYLLDRQDKENDFTAQRNKAAAEIYRDDGAVGIVKLASAVKLPHFVTQAVSSLVLSAEQLAELLSLSIDALGDNQFSNGIGFLFHERVGTEIATNWVEKNILSRNDGLPAGLGVLLNWPNTLETWNAVRSLGIEVERSYWLKKLPYWMDDAPEVLLEGIERFRAVKRPLAGLEAALNRLKDVPTNLLLTLLDEIRETLGDSDRAHSNISHEIERAFEELDRRGDAPDLAVARLEVAYHPIFQFSDRPMRVHKLIADKPEDYYELLTNVFKAEDEERSENSSPERVALAQASYALLSSFKTIPGLHEKQVDVVKLTSWIDEVRRRATKGKRGAIADQYIGHILAHSPVDEDGVWPLIAIRQQIERLKSDELQRGIQIERFNMRGVHSKAIYEGGVEERQFAAQYQGYADKAAQWPRTQLMLREIAKSWEADAEREDTWARQRKLKD